MNSDFHKKYVKITPHWKVISAEFMLTKEHRFYFGVHGYSYEDDFIKITPDGWVVLKPGFIWGASGPTVDGPEWCGAQTREASCDHDGVYYLSDKGVFKGDNSSYVRKKADKHFLKVLNKNSSWFSYPRNYTWYISVRAAGWYVWGS